jgi:cobyrinic acid a,c-diamide synthase
VTAQPALLIAGTHSGCGKTTVTLAVMAALARRGVRVQPFKCGPDFIDPSLHRLVTGRVSRNLDVRMCGTDFVRRTYARHAPADGCAIVEGVMGLFDGERGSAACLAKTLDLPVLLVVDVRSAAESVAAVVKGFDTLDPDLRVAAVVANRIGSSRHADMVATAIRTLGRPELIGLLPRREEVTIPSRHLGLHMGEEGPLTGEGLERLACLAEDHLDLDRLLALAADRQPVIASAPAEATLGHGPVRIGVGRDAAFCFYYEDNLDLLRVAGAELVFFSPLIDRELPPGLGGLYLGGGYPELHAARLAANTTMRAAIHAFADSGRPVLAECGGFMYLTRSLVDLEGKEHPMVGIYPCRARMQGRLASLGYRQPTLTRDTWLASAGTVLAGHEFHYSVLEGGPAATAVFRLDDGRAEGYLHRNTLAGYVHLHWGRTPEVAVRFVQACRLLV